MLEIYHQGYAIGDTHLLWQENLLQEKQTM